VIPDFGSHVYGGDGFDTLTVALATSPVWLELSDHDGMERIVGTGFGDLIEAGTATGERMTIEGVAGVDTLTGGTGQEWLYGGAERDMMTGWLDDYLFGGDGTLRATPLAQNTLGITEPEATTTPAEVATAPVQRRKGTKQEALIEMLRAPDGATIEEITTALEWAAHTVRGAMAGPLKKKLGLEVTSEKVEGRGRVYTLK
jgi:hypothetical protein